MIISNYFGRLAGCRRLAPGNFLLFFDELGCDILAFSRRGILGGDVHADVRKKLRVRLGPST